MRSLASTTWIALCALYLLLLTCPASACMNEEPDNTVISGRTSGVADPEVLRGMLNPPEFDTKAYEAKIKVFNDYPPAKLDRAADDHAKYEYTLVSNLINHGVDLVYAGHYAEARDLFLKLEKEYPRRYAIAATLGTTYELTGDNVNALKWIREGMNRKPDSHMRTEWLHAKILEAKLALEKDPKWLETHHVLGVDFGDQPKPNFIGPLPTGNTGEQLNIDDLTKALGYQLGERLKFIRTPEPVVADLLVDLGNVLILEESPRAAKLAYARAMDYGAKGDLLTKRVSQADELRERQEMLASVKRNNRLIFSWIGAVVMAGIIYVAFRFRR